MSEPRRGDHPVEVRLVKDPAGRPAVLLALPDGYVTMHDPGPIRQLASMLIVESDNLEAIIEKEA